MTSNPRLAMAAGAEGNQRKAPRSAATSRPTEITRPDRTTQASQNPMRAGHWVRSVNTDVVTSGGTRMADHLMSLRSLGPAHQRKGQVARSLKADWTLSAPSPRASVLVRRPRGPQVAGRRRALIARRAGVRLRRPRLPRKRRQLGDNRARTGGAEASSSARPARVTPRAVAEGQSASSTTLPVIRPVCSRASASSAAAI
jgi:hypothetical protein